ncbi:hexameric tyrosine-coordinated heme protein [Antarctobacter heliothermus]|uniref:Hexameric tyrosine-coordinated heme protein (HTHP) n=1 Tax=Antarctobacter heliothermus TaxID=74033 RepID=A0A239KKP3_9RHOB|nr:hexameric tyrosine-coordinated heme protein [Antarctobacter heliothermus]SNT18645.1 Hexameric tyrosine-coordinated heme protein (HTHP) [Antarctobacter heliothermus]
MASWLPTLKTETPEEGYDLAIKLSRVAVKLTQPDAEVRDRLRPTYAEDPDALIAVSQVVATHFATIAAANEYWRDTQDKG